MDKKICEAAMEGNVIELLNLLQQDALILDRYTLGCYDEAPLHIAALLGHAEFVQEILSRKPELAGEVDARKSSPLHLAAAKGHLAIVKMLVSVNPDSCFFCDKDGRNPLHIAAIKGHLDVLKELVPIRPKAAQMILKDRGDTIFHLCVRYNQLLALELLVKLLPDPDGLLNSKDDDGNTILHLAVADKQIEVIKFLTTQTVTEANTLNAYGFTALDISTQSRKDILDWEIGELLRRSGAKNARDIRSSSLEIVTTNIVGTSSHENHPTNELTQPKMKGSKTSDDWLKEMRSSLMVVASLIATIAFQVAVNPPGGLWQESSKSGVGAPAPSPEPAHEAGFSILAYEYPEVYDIFLASNTTSFLASLSIILLFISGLPIRSRFFMWILMVVMWIAVTTMAFTFFVAVFSISKSSRSVDIVTVIIVYVWMGLMGIILLTHVIRVIVRMIRFFWQKTSCIT